MPRRPVWPAFAAVLVAAVLTALATPPTAAHAAGLRPEIGHVFVVVIENKSFDEAYVTNPNPYLSTTLPAQGQLLTQYYGIGHESLGNYIAMLSGQAPNLLTQADCQLYMNVLPGLPTANGQVIGQGCVYPSSVKTLADQLDAKGLSWKGYMEDMGNNPGREPDRCGAPSNPSLPLPDGTQTATAGDQYAARHNPFVYFHSILDSRRCQTDVVPLDQLTGDLSTVATTPNFSFITPNLCNDGHDATCKGTNVRGTHVGGLTAIDYWLAEYVPRILASPAYQRDGLLVITADESENFSDATACCNEPTGPNTIAPGITGPGGGRTGTLLLSPFITPGSKNATPYNHYALLRSLEDIFGITTGGADGHGHLGFAGQAGLASFGYDVFPPQPVIVHADRTPASGATAVAATARLPATGGFPLAPAAAALAVAGCLLAGARRPFRRAR